jgi:nucleoside-diphosphate kinase
VDRAIQAVEGKNMIERTFAMLKPDAVTRGLTGQVIARLEAEGLKVVAMKMLRVDRKKAERLYEIHKGKPFYNGLIKYSMSGAVVAMILEGEGAVKGLRRVIGATDPAKAEPGTIRRDFGLEVLKNVIHAADSPENAEREMQIFFEKSEIVSYKRSNDVKI